MEAFNLCLLVVLLAATGTVGAKDNADDCEAIGGECRDAGDCSSPINLDGCPQDQVCCLPYGPPDVLGARVTNNCSISTKKCSRIGGECFDTIEARQCDFVKQKKCNFNNCGCCVHCRNQKINKKCKKLYGGSCATKCGPEFLEVRSCKAGCKCCGCQRLDECKNAGGSCVTKKSLCDGRVVSKWCSGNSCHCCIPVLDSCRENTTACLKRGGRCDESCETNEVSVKGLCNDNCPCCVPRPSCPNTDKCKSIKGECMKKCDCSQISVPSFCPDLNCTCCSSIEPNSERTCAMMGGSCYTVGEKLCVGRAYGNCGTDKSLCCVKKELACLDLP